MPYDADRQAFGYCPELSVHLDGLTVRVEVVAPFIESAACAQDSDEVMPVAVDDQRLQCGNVIEQPAHVHHGAELFVGQVFVEHRQVVAEVEEGLHRVALRQRAAADMVHLTFGDAHHASSSLSQSPTEVNLLVVGKEAGVECSRLPIVFGTDHQTGTRSPQHIHRIVILSVVALHGVEDTAAAQRIAEAVEEAAGGTGILEAVLVGLTEQFGLTGRHVVVRVHILLQRREPVVCHLHVGVEQHIVVGLYLSQRTVVAVGKAVVAVEHERLHFRELLCEHLHRIVGRGIVGHPYLRVVARVFQHGGQEALHHLPPIPVQYDDCCLHCLNHLFLYVGLSQQRFFFSTLSEVAECHVEDLIVVLLASLTGGQGDTDIVVGEAVHGVSGGSFLEEHGSRLSDIVGIEVVGLAVGEFQESF